MKLTKAKVERFLMIFSRLYQQGHISKDDATIFALMYVKAKRYIKLEENVEKPPELSDSTIEDFI